MKKTLMFLVLPLCISVLLVSCEKVNECSVCEEIFKIVTVKINSSALSSVSFDEIYTLRISTGEKIFNSMNASPVDGNYVILDDSYHPKLKNQSDLFKLIGVKNGVKVFEEPYELYGDECHIGKRTGKETITVN